MGPGVDKRLEILENEYRRDIEELLKTFQWNCTIEGKYENGEYIIIRIERGNTTHRLALMYSSATANTVYKKLEQLVDIILINGGIEYVEKFAYGISKEVVEKDNFIKTLKKWNEESTIDGIVEQDDTKIAERISQRFPALIQSEDPIRQIWQILKLYGNQSVAMNLLAAKYSASGTEIPKEILERKATGLSFCLQNAYEYFQQSINANLSQRILNLYYGLISFASAEMISSIKGPNTLDEIESMTKYGHGLYTMDIEDVGSIDGFSIGVLGSGFFKNWMEYLGKNISFYPTKKPKTATDILEKDCSYTLMELFSRIPEIEYIFNQICSLPFNWLDTNYDSKANPYCETEKSESYIVLTDHSYNKTIPDIKGLPYGFTEIQNIETEYPGRHFRVLVKHSGKKYWYENLPLHHSPYCSTRIIVPIFKDIYEYRAITTSILYGLSIIVRYRPSIWREITNGKYGKYKALIEYYLEIVERIIPQEYISIIIGDEIFITNPGSLFAVS